MLFGEIIHVWVSKHNTNNIAKQHILKPGMDEIMDRKHSCSRYCHKLDTDNDKLDKHKKFAAHARWSRKRRRYSTYQGKQHTWHDTAKDESLHTSKAGQHINGTWCGCTRRRQHRHRKWFIWTNIFHKDIDCWAQDLFFMFKLLSMGTMRTLL